MLSMFPGQGRHCLPLPSVEKVALCLSHLLHRLMLTMAGTSAQMERASGSKHTCHDVLCEYFTSETLSHHGSFDMSWGL